MNVELIKSLIMLAQILFIVRFHLEIARLNAFMEPVNTLRKITNPLVLPVKKILPWQTKRFAALIVAYVVGLALLLIFTGTFNPLVLIVQAFMWLVVSWIKFIQYGIFIYVIGSWIQIPALQRTNIVLHALFEPMLAPIRRVLPDFGGLDFSPMVLLIGLSLITSLI